VSIPFEPGERILLLDQRQRTYLVKLQAGGTFHSHGGTLPHDVLIGRNEGARVATATGMVLVAYRPRVSDFVLRMPRGAQVVYPKDIGPILVDGDIFPGARVLEAGTGSGALTIVLSRAVGDGLVVSYESRPEHREQAIANIETFFGKIPEGLELREGQVNDVAATGERFDRAVLDLAEPWTCLEAVAGALDPGGVLSVYLPTTIQVQQVVLALPPAGFQHLETFEVLHRSWHVTDRSVRPDHRMVAHTGFVSIARRG
jgi:tRNA (adenine57-N1/adenine58-N1)-methyltransferase